VTGTLVYVHTSTRTLLGRIEDQLAVKSAHLLTKKSVLELNDQPMYIKVNIYTYVPYFGTLLQFKFL
jgi:hypothetical protein